MKKTSEATSGCAETTVPAASAERFDRLMQVTRPRGWIALSALSLIIMMGVLWGVGGTLPDVVEAQGVLMHAGGVRVVTSPADGVLQQFDVVSGQEVKANECVGRVASSSGSVPINCPEQAVVLRSPVREGDRVAQGDELLHYELPGEPMQVLVYLPCRQGYRLKRGMEVQVTPANAKLIESGYLRGKVLDVVMYPATLKQMVRRIADETMARKLFDAGCNLEVVVRLQRDVEESPDAKNGYEWSSKKGKRVSLHSGTPCRVRIIVDTSVSPIERILPKVGS